MDKKKEEEKSFEIKVLEAKYKQRFTLIKLASIAIDNGDPHQAIRNYEELFEAICHQHKVKIFDLNPIHITGRQAPAERLLISQAFYNLARLTDLKTDAESMKNTPLYLNQFAKFTTNQPFQSLNTRMLFKHLKRTKFRNRQAFDSTYKKIIAESKMCFFANYCFGNEHPITNHFRSLKPKLLNYRWGERVVNTYYNYSGSLVHSLELNALISNVFKNLLFKPLFFVVYSISRLIND